MFVFMLPCAQAFHDTSAPLTMHDTAASRKSPPTGIFSVHSLMVVSVYGLSCARRQVQIALYLDGYLFCYTPYIPLRRWLDATNRICEWLVPIDVVVAHPADQGEQPLQGQPVPKWVTCLCSNLGLHNSAERTITLHCACKGANSSCGVRSKKFSSFQSGCSGLPGSKASIVGNCAMDSIGCQLNFKTRLRDHNSGWFLTAFVILSTPVPCVQAFAQQLHKGTCGARTVNDLVCGLNLFICALQYIP